MLNWGFNKKQESDCPSVFLSKSSLKPCKNICVLWNGNIEPLSEKNYFENFKVNYIDHLFIADYTDYARLKEKTKLQLSNEIPHQMALWAKAMFLQEFERGIHPRLLIKKIDSIVGFGVVALEDISQYSYIGEYAGIVRKRSRRKDELNDYVFGFPICNKDSPFVIDAKDFGNHTRFINHSDEPNLFSRWMEKDGICHVILYANRLIKQGEQLSYDYGPLYWRKRPAPIAMVQN